MRTKERVFVDCKRSGRTIVRRCIVSFAVLAGLLTGGCGDGDRLSRGEFTRRATAICTPVQRELEALPQPQSLPELELYAQEAEDLTAGGVERL